MLCAAAVVLLPLSACSSEKDQQPAPSTQQDTTQTLAATISDAPGLTITARALRDIGIAPVFDGAGSYTILAPDDDAFGLLGETGTYLQQPEQAPIMAAILRDHIIPGYLTRQDIDNAVKAADSGEVRMRTLGNHFITFSHAQSGLVVTSENGQRAHLAQKSLEGSNGVAIPIDVVLKDVKLDQRSVKPGQENIQAPE
ncbi:fasciclin domain-containing protein [Altericroceibacterium endophyticum]|uniref:fasciclin domain-containing protein n=1 Tax=Altericroceibacterium endophyticum TaxID=1808508 RepID=UPI00136AC8DF|nr:fasciclin domain-containing protein [Altericroceibacterium endophyticum]